MSDQTPRPPVHRAAVLSAVPALLIAAWLAAPAHESASADPTWPDDHHTLSTDWDDLGHTPVR